MKKLLTYFNALNRKERAGMLAAIGMTEGYLRRACCTGVNLSPERCVAIERATGGLVTRKDLRPNDWQDIWPELSQSLSNQGLGQDAGANSLADKLELAEKGE